MRKFIEHIFAQARSYSLQVSDVLTDGKDFLDLGREESALDERGRMDIIVLHCHHMQFQQFLIDSLLEFQCLDHGVYARPPVVCSGGGDLLEIDLTSPHVLILHEGFSAFPLLRGHLLEEFLESWQSDVTAAKVMRHTVVNVSGVHVEVDLTVDSRLRPVVEVVATPRDVGDAAVGVVPVAVVMPRVVVLILLRRRLVAAESFSSDGEKFSPTQS